MGFIRNFEIWNNQRPRVCNFDILDYCAEGIIGNTCTEITTPIDSIDWDITPFTTSKASRDAWINAVNEYVLALNTFYYDDGWQGETGGYPTDFPGENNVKCITPENYGKFLDLYYGPTGFIAKYKEWLPASLLWWNCILNPIYKQTGIVTDTVLLPVSPQLPSQPWTFTVDYTNYQTATKARYLEYRAALDAMLAALKIFMHISGKQPLTHYDIVPQPCPDLTIGTQVWKRCNLSVTKYRNGDTIPQVTDPTAWANLTTGAWCYYDNDPTTESIYGRLYNWYAVNDPRGLAPTGYHIPTSAEWTTLTDYVGGDLAAGGILKESGVNGDADCQFWNDPNTSTNERGFTALPAGLRIEDGTFDGVHLTGRWWTSSDFNSTITYYRSMAYNTDVVITGIQPKKRGLSVRLVKD